MIIGAEMAVMVPPNDKYGLDEYEIRNYMKKVQQDDPTLIRAYSFTSYTLNTFPEFPDKMYLIHFFLTII